jgi:hypothetical protein
MKYLISLTALFSLFILLPQQALASDCKPLYNGGVTTQQLCNGSVSSPFDNNTSTTLPKPKATPTPIKIQTQPGTTKGGLTVQPVAPGKTTPSTGPEALGIIALFPAGALGFYLRKKA